MNPPNHWYSKRPWYVSLRYSPIVVESTYLKVVPLYDENETLCSRGTLHVATTLKEIFKNFEELEKLIRDDKKKQYFQFLEDVKQTPIDYIIEHGDKILHEAVQGWLEVYVKQQIGKRTIKEVAEGYVDRILKKSFQVSRVGYCIKMFNTKGENCCKCNLCKSDVTGNNHFIELSFIGDYIPTELEQLCLIIHGINVNIDIHKEV